MNIVGINPESFFLERFIFVTEAHVCHHNLQRVFIQCSFLDGGRPGVSVTLSLTLITQRCRYETRGRQGEAACIKSISHISSLVHLPVKKKHVHIFICSLSALFPSCFLSHSQLLDFLLSPDSSQLPFQRLFWSPHGKDTDKRINLSSTSLELLNSA